MTGQGGEIVVWSLKEFCEIALLHLPMDVAKISFGNNESEIIYADITGKIGVISLNRSLFTFGKKCELKEKSRYECMMGSPLTAMKMFRGFLYVGTKNGTEKLDVSKMGLLGEKIDDYVLMLFDTLNPANRYWVIKQLALE